MPWMRESDQTANALIQVTNLLLAKQRARSALMNCFREWWVVLIQRFPRHTDLKHRYSQHFPELSQVLHTDHLEEEYHHIAIVIGVRKPDPKQWLGSAISALHRITKDTRVSYRVIAASCVSAGMFLPNNLAHEITYRTRPRPERV